MLARSAYTFHLNPLYLIRNIMRFNFAYMELTHKLWINTFVFNCVSGIGFNGE
jgi:hypothetical protein